jgi:type I restriction enzyme S subunit
MSDDLPQGWVTTRVSDVAETRSGGTPSTAKREYWDNGDVPWINSGALKDCVISQPSTYITKLGSENSAAKLFPKNTVVIALTGATTGRVGILDFACSANQSVTGMFPSETYLPSYLFNFLRSARPAVLELAIGSAQPHINKKIVDDFEIPLAPLAEQRRIVAKLEALLDKVDTSQQRLTKIPVLLKRFRQSVLATACSGRLTTDWREENDDTESSSALIVKILAERNKRYKATCAKCVAAGIKSPKRPKNLTRAKLTHYDLPDIPETWEWVCWDDLADWITYGFTRPMPHVTKGIPIITAKNVRDGFLDFSQPEFTTTEAFTELSEKDKPRRSEILITKDGAIRGRAALVQTDEPFCISQAVAVVRFGGLTAHEPFLLRVVQSRFTQDLIEAESMGTAIPHISITNFGRFPVPLPSLPEQREIVRRVEGLFALADQLEVRLATARRQVDALTPSLLARAFRGELVPQDPNDEPASILLDRIRSNQNALKKRSRQSSFKQSRFAQNGLPNQSRKR